MATSHPGASSLLSVRFLGSRLALRTPERRACELTLPTRGDRCATAGAWPARFAVYVRAVRSAADRGSRRDAPDRVGQHVAAQQAARGVEQRVTVLRIDLGHARPRVHAVDEQNLVLVDVADAGED